MRALHLATRSEYDAGRASGGYRGSTRGATVDDVGFAHLATSAQVAGVARRFYADVDEPLVVLVVDLDTCSAAGLPVRWEPASDAGGELFPHVPGVIPADAVVAELPAVLESSGLSIQGLDGLDVASEPPAAAGKGMA